MTRRDWVLFGTAALFLGVGLGCWKEAQHRDMAALTLAGALPVVWGMAALFELARRSLR